MVNAGEQPKREGAVNILLVDDRADNLVALESVLQELGQNLVRARSGREALKHLLHEDFAVILLDVQMPGMDGFETARLIRERERSRLTPILFLTAINKDEVHVSRGYSVGAVDYVFKPFDADVLRAKISAFVQLSRKQQELESETAQRRKAEGAVRSLNADLERRVRQRTGELEHVNRELEAARQRLEFLAGASTRLADSLDYATTLERVARLPVPYLADFCVVELLDEEGILRKASAAHRDPERNQELVALEYGYRPPRDGPCANSRVLETARAEIRSGPECAGWPGEGVPVEVLRSLEPTACLVAPLTARGRTVGVITFGSTQPAGHYGPAEASLAEDYSRRAAAAIENARLFYELGVSDQRKDEFLAMLAHELRNPLAAIGNADYALAELEPRDARVRRLRAIITRQTQHLSRLVDDLLDISRITRGKIELRSERVELAPIVQRAAESVGSLIATRCHTLTLALPPRPVWLHADPTRLEQIFCNLLNNAAKYTDTGGSIWLDVEPANGAAAEVLIRVRDTGLGLSPQLLPRVFDLFTQAERSLDRSQGGLGIGLALVRNLVQLHHGGVSVESDGLGRGSEFTVRLPMLPDGAEEEASPPADVLETAARGTVRSRRILLIEDNEDSAETLTEILELWGHHVLVVNDGPTGLAAAPQYRPEVVLLDIGLPGMDGYEVARRLRKAEGGSREEPHPAAFVPQPLLVALTGYGQEEDRRRACEAGFDLYLTKPVDPPTLQRLLADIK